MADSPTVAQVWESFTDKQKEAIYTMIGCVYSRHRYTPYEKIVFDSIYWRLNKEQQIVVDFLIAKASDFYRTKKE